MTAYERARLALDQLRERDHLWFVRADRSLVPVKAFALVSGNEWRTVRVEVQR